MTNDNVQHRFWLLVANGTEARIFGGAGPIGDLEDVEQLHNPTTRRHERELVTDRPGRRSDPTAHFSAVNTTDRKGRAADDFAVELADYLESHHLEGDFEVLTIVASPSMLGTLRDKLPANVRDVVLEEIASDLTSEPPAEIQARLEQLHA